jgi:7,8-dihydropterin-6-yl-methyl-4-(beta-D-ribofuranosyl)aminobenzene 5'-phosphate synthase
VNNLSARRKLYGLYEGLHFAPLGKFRDEERGWIGKMSSYGLKKIAANHGTGLVAVQRMVELGHPLVKGTGSKGPQRDLNVTNGNSVFCA